MFPSILLIFLITCVSYSHAGQPFTDNTSGDNSQVPSRLNTGITFIEGGGFMLDLGTDVIEATKPKTTQPLNDEQLRQLDEELTRPFKENEGIIFLPGGGFRLNLGEDPTEVSDS
jgi:hypothetical protein